MEGSEALARVARLFKIITLVTSQTSGRPLGREHLANACGCSLRTIQRDTDLLQEAGIPLTYDAGLRMYVLTEKEWTFPVVRLMAEDALALALLQGIIGTPGFPQREELQATLSKLTAGVAAGLMELMREASKSLQSRPLARDYSHAPIRELAAAASAGQSVDLDYHSRSRGERAWRRVDPYVVEARAGQFWELHGWCHRNSGIRTFALDQVFGMRAANEGFTVRQSEWGAFAAAKGIVGGLRGGASVSVDVVFLPPVAPYARDHRWPEGLRLETLGDGTARLTGAALGTDGLVAELLRWRRFCRVDGGPELRARMIEEVQAITDLYR